MPASSVHTREVPCPRCGYDLRAAVDRRCPECGAIASSLSASRIPWVHRKHRGRVKAYLQTLRMVLFSTGRFAPETNYRVSRVHARRFHRISMALATFIATGLLLATFALRGEQWRADLSARVPWNYLFNISMVGSQPPTDPVDISFPMYALTDTFWIAIPIVLSCYACLAFSMGIYRLILRLFTGNRLHRRRVRRLGFYASAVTLPFATFAGLLSAGGMIMYEEHPWLTGTFEAAWTTTLVVLAILTVVFFYVPTFRFIWSTGNFKILRTILMFPIFPYAVTIAGVALGYAIFWSTGYLATILWSMLH